VSGLAGVQLKMVDSIDDAWDLKAWLGERRDVLAIDTETEGLQWWHEKVRLIQLGDAMTGWAIPWDLWGGIALEAIKMYDEGPMVFHNAKFDVHMIEHWTKHRLPYERIDDTRVMGHILDPNRPTGLKTLASLFVDRQAATASRVLDEAMAKNGWTWATVPIDFEPYWAYGALDTVLTARLWQVLKPQVMAEAPRAYDLEMAVTWVISRMERKGLALDVQYTRERKVEFDTYVNQVEEFVQDTYGCKPGSNEKIIEIVSNATGWQPTKQTAGGAWSLDKEVLEEMTLRTGHPLAQLILQRRRLQKLSSTYLSNFLKLESGGRIHPSFNTLKNENSKYGARTGRMSVTDPALQTLPRRSESNPAAIMVRNCITASEGSSLIMCDFDQIEMRMFGHFSRDPGLMAAFGEGDFFTNVCRQLWNDATIVKKDERRQHTKNGMYALGYGAGEEKIALTTGQTLEAVQQFLAMLAATFPGIKSFQKQVERVALDRKVQEGAGYVRSPLTGRKFTADDGKEYALVNYLIQGTAAEVLKIKNLELDAAGLGDYMILDVHDEVILDVPDDDVAEVAPLVQSIVQDDKLFAVPLTAGVDISKRWGEKAA
jgi:DNA polymerase I-like protein with 3'-5' exonuclease and polymerase domains